MVACARSVWVVRFPALVAAAAFVLLSIVHDQLLEILWIYGERLASAWHGRESMVAAVRSVVGYEASLLLIGVVVWYWARALLDAHMAQHPDLLNERRMFVETIPRLLAMLIYAGAVLGLARAAALKFSFVRNAEVRWWLVAILAVTGCCAAALYAFFWLRRKVLDDPIPDKHGAFGKVAILVMRGIHAPASKVVPERWSTGRAPGGLPVPQTRSSHDPSSPDRLFVLTVSVVGAVALAFLIPAREGAFALWLGTVPVALLCFAALTPIGSLLTWFGNSRHVPLLTIVVLAGVLMTSLGCNDNHGVRTLGRLDAGGRAERAELGSLCAQFKTWLDNRPDRQAYAGAGKKYPVVFVTAEGGASRAAYMAALPLAYLQDKNADFSEHVFAISSVSGGSVGASVFAGLCAAEERGRKMPRGYVTATDDALKGDFVAPVVASALFTDLLQRVLPCRLWDDRAVALEQGFEHGMDDAIGDPPEKDANPMRSPFAALWRDERSRVPNLMLNTTNVELGSRVVVTNLRLGRFGADEKAARRTTRRSKSVTGIRALCFD